MSYHFVDSPLLGLAETLAKIVEQYPNIIEISSEEYASVADAIRGKMLSARLPILFGSSPQMADWSENFPTRWHNNWFPITRSVKSV